MSEFRELVLATEPPPARHVLCQMLVLDFNQWLRERNHRVDTPGAVFIRKLTLVEDGRLYLTFSEGPPDA